MVHHIFQVHHIRPSEWMDMEDWERAFIRGSTLIRKEQEDEQQKELDKMKASAKRK